MFLAADTIGSNILDSRLLTAFLFSVNVYDQVLPGGVYYQVYQFLSLFTCPERIGGTFGESRNDCSAKAGTLKACCISMKL